MDEAVQAMLDAREALRLYYAFWWSMARLLRTLVLYPVEMAIDVEREAVMR